MKFIILSVLVLFVVASLGSTTYDRILKSTIAKTRMIRGGVTCSTISSCVDVGNTCNSDTLDTMPCITGATCHLNVANGTGSGTCEEMVEGRSCSNNEGACIPSALDPPLECSTSDVCVANLAGALYNGDSCSTTSQCAVGTCSGGTCTAEASGGDCITNANCQGNLVCLPDGTCGSPLSRGSNCSSLIDQCTVGDVCDESTCVELFSKSNGASCTSDFGCSSGLCDDGICTSVSSTGGSCTGSSTCNDGYSCSCGFTGSLFCAFSAASSSTLLNCKDKYVDFAQCLFDNNCNSNSQPNIDQACANQCQDKSESSSNCGAEFVFGQAAYSSAPDSCKKSIFSGANMLDSFLF